MMGVDVYQMGTYLDYNLHKPISHGTPMGYGTPITMIFTYPSFASSTVISLSVFFIMKKNDQGSS